MRHDRHRSEVPLARGPRLGPHYQVHGFDSSGRGLWKDLTILYEYGQAGAEFVSFGFHRSVLLRCGRMSRWGMVLPVARHRILPRLASQGCRWNALTAGDPIDGGDFRSIFSRS